jgi:hypothetical protein
MAMLVSVVLLALVCQFSDAFLLAFNPLDLGFCVLLGIVVQTSGQWSVVEVGFVPEQGQRVVFDLVADLCGGKH